MEKYNVITYFLNIIPHRVFKERAKQYFFFKENKYIRTLITYMIYKPRGPNTETPKTNGSMYKVVLKLFSMYMI